MQLVATTSQTCLSKRVIPGPNYQTTSPMMSKHSPEFLYASVLCVTIIFIFLLCWRERRHRSNVPLPPGPKGLPIVGNLFRLATSGSTLWEAASEWGKTYGEKNVLKNVLKVQCHICRDMVYFEVAGFSMLIINSHDVAVDLFCKRSSVYSSRPQFIMPSLWVSVRFQKIFANCFIEQSRLGLDNSCTCIRSEASKA